jgi:hypothetical protein
MISHDLCAVDFRQDQSEDPRFPNWPCPACGHGVLQLSGKSIRFASSATVGYAIGQGFIERWEDRGVFCATLDCINDSCQQGVVILGDYDLETPDGQYYVIGRGPIFRVVRRYLIRALHPAIRFIDIPQQLPPPILAPLEESFALYWSHPQACAGLIRTAIEGIADHLGQPGQVRGKFIPLAQRLKNLTPQHPDLAKAATAIKDFGNIGAHGNIVEHQKLLVAYELVEMELRLLFEDTDSRRDALIGKLKN